MSKDIKSDHKHLTLSDRIYIEQALIRGDNFRMIAQALGKDPTTISLEIRRFLEWNDGLYARDGVNDCAHYSSCDVEYLCGLCELPCKNCLSNKCTKLCPSYDPIICEDLKSPPYVCNGCRILETCQATHYYYRTEEAQKRYKALLSESREGINMTEEQLKELDDFISPLSVMDSLSVISSLCMETNSPAVARPYTTIWIWGCSQSKMWICHAGSATSSERNAEAKTL